MTGRSSARILHDGPELAAATARLARALGAEVAGFGCIIELAFLGGRGKLGDLDSVSLLSYE